jgi:ribonuclease III
MSMVAPQVNDGARDEALTAWLRGLLARDPRRLDPYRAALTHRSAHHDNNERLEFLGDAVLGMVIGEELFRRFPAASEGVLSRLRSRLVSTGPLAAIGLAIGIGSMLRLGSGELRSGGFRRESILADATEALFGAIHMESGIDAARELILRLYRERLDELRPESELKDAKTRLQELLQGRGEALPVYVLEGASGEPHEQVFAVQCQVRLAGGGELLADGAGSSRRRAEQEAAAGLLGQLQERWRA